MTGRRLLVINTSRSWGGTEHWAVQTAAGLAARGAQVRFLCSSDVVDARAARAGLDVGRLRLAGDLEPRGILRLVSEVRRLRPHAVIATRWRESLLGGLAVRLAGRPRPWLIMRLGLRLVPRQDLKRRLVFRLADRVIVNAPEIRKALLQRSWIDPARVVVILNGLDLAAWRPRWEPGPAAAGARLRERFGIPADAPLLVNVGALTPQKDHAGLLAAMAELRRAVPDARLLIVGEGFLRGDLEALRARLHLQDHVLMPGFLDDVAAALAAADLFVLSSDNEGMARALIEAAASGLPAVATDVSGSRLAVREGINGRVVPPRRPGALVAAIGEVLSLPAADRQQMGEAARRLAEQRFDQARMLDEVEAVLRGEVVDAWLPGSRG